MNIDEILDVMDDMLDRAWNLPLTGGRCVVDAERVRDLIDDIRLNMPAEIKQAKQIVADRAEIISVAKTEADAIVRKAEERAKHLVSEAEVNKQAKAKAEELLAQSRMKSREMRQATQEFVDNMLKNTEETLGRSLSDVRSTRQALRNPARPAPQEQEEQK
ncbi:MAG: ATPase [Oscillospiraceae bacterium]|nr:ATPase [Oscillospiraceae bacterium]MDY4190995.1 ATPase [Oscillospiraceae bacterium]